MFAELINDLATALQSMDGPTAFIVCAVCVGGIALLLYIIDRAV